MAKFVLDAVLDAALNEVKNNASKLILCEGQPANYTNATTLKSGGGSKLGEIAITGVDITLADGDTNGRKLTVAQQTGITVDESGTVDHIAIVDDTGTRLLLVTTVAGQAVTAGNTATVNAFDEEIADAS